MKKIILLVFLVLMASAYAQMPKIDSYVVDKAGILSPESKSNLEKSLRELEKQTNGVQFVVYVENSYSKDYSLEEYTLKIAETNGIGKKGNDNGVLLYVAVQDREFRWEVGYGAESILNAALLGRVSRDYIIPNFKSGNYEKGIVETADIVQRLLLNSNDADIVALKSEKKKSPGIYKIVIMLIIISIVLNIVSSLANRSNKKIRGSHDAHIYRGAANGIFIGGFGRGGFGGGGFGGFSGGGGGFGGGGFSGRF